MISKKKSIFVSILVLFIAFLTGCSFLGEKTPGTAVVPSPVYSLPPITQTATPSFSHIPESTSSPTVDSFKATSSAYLATNWAPVYATLDKRAVRCDDGYQLEFPEIVDGMSSETWSIFTCSPQIKDYKTIATPGLVDFRSRYTKLIKTDFSQSWTISHREFLWSNRPNAYLSSRWWTQDGKYVYLVSAWPSGSGYNAPGFFVNGDVLYRFDLISGEFETVLPYLKNSYAFSLSPNDEYLAYANLNEKKIVRIRNMNNGEEQQVKLVGDYVLTGAFAWKLDSTQLIFASAMNGWEEGNAGISIYMFNMKNRVIQNVLFNDRRLLIPFPNWEGGRLNYWTNKNLLNVWSLNYMSVEYFSDLALDIQSKNIIVIATPRPGLAKTATPRP